MNNYEKFGWISGQVLVGIGFGVIGAVLLVIIAGLAGEQGDLGLFGGLLLLGFYAGFPIGICYDGYKLLKNFGQEKRMFRQCCFCLAGNLLVPFIGAVAGFNYTIHFQDRPSNRTES